MANHMLHGGEFLLKDSDAQDVYIPEEFTEEQRMIQETVRSFVDQEIVPVAERIESLEEGLVPQLLEKIANLGMLGTHMPSAVGGSELDYVTNTLIGEEIGPSGSFSVSFNAHIGIGMLPILYYGTEAQKQQYLPGLVTGKIKAGYCLTEPSSGSDALAAKTTANISEDGEYYLLNGQKMWITNAGFADLFTVFAQVNGNAFTAFLVHSAMEGVTTGAEEKKLGIKGSSTRQVFFENVKVPKDHVLGEVGKGHLIAFHVLNTGRLKLCASVLGGAKKLAEISVRYAVEREQFQQPIASFGAIGSKLAEQYIRCFAVESALYRTSHLIQLAEDQARASGVDFSEAKQDAAEEFAIECSILKIIGSEALDYVVDEAVQIHGGMGYSEDGVIARAYRDARINRIFEGTNEINRLLILSTLFKRALKGRLDLMTPGLAVEKEITSGISEEGDVKGLFTDEQKIVRAYKKILIMLLGTAARQAMSGKLDLKAEQEVLMYLSDLILDIFMAESVLLRVQKQHALNVLTGIEEDLLYTFINDCNHRVRQNAVNAIASFVEPNMQSAYVQATERYTSYGLKNNTNHRRKISAYLIARLRG
ncbi:MAG: acyl-CoA dehydrogenase family protein [Saprospiraceae bacterium]|nr:acyl-CoA dehydrogenase family protein [Saprospiraceae bacterium]